MNIWDEMQRALDRDDIDTLRILAARIPRALEEVEAHVRARAQSVGVEVLYQLEELERAIAWASPPLSAITAMWLGYSLFDLARYREAVVQHRRALAELDLAPWARLKINELVLCCDVYLGSETVTGERFAALQRDYLVLGDGAPVPVELGAALSAARASGVVSASLLSYAEALFQPLFERWRLRARTPGSG